jgi:ABC-2 type transport system permease protein
MRYLSLLSTFLGMHLKTMLQYRVNFLMGTMSQIIYTLLSAIFVSTFMQSGDMLQGWNFWQVIFLFGFGDLSFGLSAVFMFRLFLSFESVYIIQGRLDHLLVQPVNPLYSLVLRNIDLNHVAIVIKGVALVVTARHMLNEAWSVLDVIGLAFLVICAAIVYTGLYLAFLSLGFWFKRRSSLALPMLSMNYLAQYPLSIYPGPLQLFLTFIVPVGLATFYPARLLLGITAEHSLYSFEFWILPLISLGVMALGLGIFRLGLHTYVSSGT